MPEHECLPLDQTAADVVGTFGELSGLPVRAARQRASTYSTWWASTRPVPAIAASPPACAADEAGPAIVGDPEVVLLDEPTAGLDPLGREEMLALMYGLGTFGVSVFLATHLLDDVQQVCDHVVMLDAGRLVVSGATGSLLSARRPHVDVGPDRQRPRQRSAPVMRARRSRGRRGGGGASASSMSSATSSPTSPCDCTA